MKPTSKPVSKLKLVLMWSIFLGLLLFWIGFLLSGHRTKPAAEEAEPGLFQAIGMLIASGFFLLLGVVSYVVAVASDCFTFNFNKPVWRGIKGKLYLANIIVLTAWALGLGFGLSVFVAPVLRRAGLSGELATLVPVMFLVVALQVVRVFVLIWAPLERRLIQKRLAARGLSEAQLQTALLVGISDPQRSSFKKFSQVEEDIGALWAGPDQLIYWGDAQEFALTREQVLQIERRADTGGTTFLAGLTHVILHLRQVDGTERQLRFHTEGHWTMAAKNRAMDELERQVAAWQGAAAVPGTV